jgi:release factor glutamine methyltransferase
MEDAARDREALIREKYALDTSSPELEKDMARLASGEPLAYVIGNIPFLGVSVGLESRPLIPRPETEWWTEELIANIGSRTVTVLDLCAGSGAIGLAILKHCGNADITFSELSGAHSETTKNNIARNHLDTARTHVVTGDLFVPCGEARYDFIVTNPPYIPSVRVLDEEVTRFEPHEALFSGKDGMDVIRRIAHSAPKHLVPHGALWMECDTSNIQEAASLLRSTGFCDVTIRTDHYGRERLVVAKL